MNKEYTYLDGKVIIRDEKDNQIQSEYYDNLERVLKQENLIERINNRINILNEQKEKIKDEKFFPTSTLAILTALVISFFVLNKIGISFIENSLTFAIFYTPFLIFDAVILINEIIQHNCEKENNRSIRSELDLLEKQLVIEKEKLSKLNTEKTRNNEKKEFRRVEVDDLEEKKALSKKLKLYREIGEEIKLYYSLYQKGLLQEKLENKYSKEDIELVSSYLAEEGPSLIKKRRYC